LGQSVFFFASASFSQGLPIVFLLGLPPRDVFFWRFTTPLLFPSPLPVSFFRCPLCEHTKLARLPRIFSRVRPASAVFCVTPPPNLPLVSEGPVLNRRFPLSSYFFFARVHYASAALRPRFFFNTFPDRLLTVCGICFAAPKPPQDAAYPRFRRHFFCAFDLGLSPR